MTTTDRDRGCNHSPRPDPGSDSALWEALLSTVRAQAGEDPKIGELGEILRCLYDVGAALEVDVDYGLVIRPGECPRAEYEAFRGQHLAPRRAEIMALLRKASASASVVAQVREVEARLLSFGWTSQEIWAERPWDAAGRRRQSLYGTLASAVHTWSGASVRVGAVSAESAEILVNGRSLFLYRVSPAVRPPDPREPPSAKKEAV